MQASFLRSSTWSAHSAAGAWWNSVARVNAAETGSRNGSGQATQPGDPKSPAIGGSLDAQNADSRSPTLDPQANESLWQGCRFAGRVMESGGATTSTLQSARGNAIATDISNADDPATERPFGHPLSRLSNFTGRSRNPTWSRDVHVYGR